MDLVKTLLGGDLEGQGITVDPGSIAYFGDDQAAGVFSGGAGVLDSQSDSPLDAGIILATGRATNAPGSNFSGGASDDLQRAADPQLAVLFDQLAPGVDFADQTVLAFDFVPQTNVVRFQFVFGSEEYHEFVNRGFSDVFGLFVNGENFARVPGTDTYIAGTGDVVSVDTVNQQTNSQFFVNNSFRPTAPFGPLSVEYDGLTTVITVVAPVRQGESNTLALAIADVGDSLLDSAIFIKAASVEAFTEEVEQAKGQVLADELSGIIAAAEANDTGLTEAATHLQIHQPFLYSLIKEVGVDLVGDTLVIPVDPVRATLLTPAGQQLKLGDNPAGVIPNAFYTRRGADELLIIPNATLGQYAVELAGMGTGEFRFGASMVAADGAVTSVLLQGDLFRATTAAVLDFRTTTPPQVTALTYFFAMPAATPWAGPALVPPPRAELPVNPPVVPAHQPPTVPANPLSPSNPERRLTAVLEQVFSLTTGATTASAGMSAPTLVFAGGETATLTTSPASDWQSSLARSHDADSTAWPFGRKWGKPLQNLLPSLKDGMAALNNGFAQLVDTVFAEAVSGKLAALSARWNGTASTVAGSFAPTLALPLSLLDVLRNHLADSIEEATQKPPEQPDKTEETSDAPAPAEQDHPQGQALRPTERAESVAATSVSVSSSNDRGSETAAQGSDSAAE